jgi:hypothetical protein
MVVILHQTGEASEGGGCAMRVNKFLVVVVAAVMVLTCTLPAVAQPYPDLEFVDKIIDEALENIPSEGLGECGWYRDDRYGWQYWCWSKHYGWYLADGCVNQTTQQSNSPTGGTNYSYQSCSTSS